MCLGIPGQVVGMLEGYGDQLALVNVAGENRKVNIGMLPEETFDAGDWVIIHMGFVVEKTDKAGADAAMAGLEMMGRGSDEKTPFHDRQAQAACLRARRRPGRGVPAVRLRRAAALGLSGSVRNDSSGAVIEVEGDAGQIDDFLLDLRDRPPPLAVIESIEIARHLGRRRHRLHHRGHVTIGRRPHPGLPRRRHVRRMRRRTA